MPAGAAPRWSRCARLSTVVSSAERAWRNGAVTRGSFARAWLLAMIARKRFVRLEAVIDGDFREQLSRAASSPSSRRAMLKDAHLIEAARETDRIVLSLDEEAAGCFRGACAEVAKLRDVLWANPEVEQEEVADWLRRGARPETRRRLGRGGGETTSR